MATDPMNPGQTASDIYRDFLERQLRGDEGDLNALCAKHPEMAAELESLGAEHRKMLQLLSQSPPPSSPGHPEAETRAPSRGDGSTRGEDEGRIDQRARYEMHEQLAQGGMGRIVLAWDHALRRKVAMKVALESTSKVDTILARFIQEAQVTGQLDHPGIPPVHELGVDGEGHPYFTMRLVRGRDLKQIFELAWTEREGWNLTRALGDLLKVCEAMAFAHEKGVIHRDLKPANVMVGRYGEVYVMDWGLARVLDGDDLHDIRLRSDGSSPPSLIQSNRHDQCADTPDSPLVTMDGDVVGTPAYMPPEQAMGLVDRTGPRADVYAVGAMLYHLLARQAPYMPRGVKISQRTVLQSVIDGPPKSVEQLNPEVPAELAAICEKAMAREIEHRYAGMRQMADDLHAYLEHRVVEAYETGAVAEFKKWMTRNRGVALALASTILILVFGLAATSLLWTKATASAALAKKESGRALAQEERATREAKRALSLSAMKRLQELATRAALLWPRWPDKVGDMRGWLAEAHQLADKRSLYQEYLHDLESKRATAQGVVESADYDERWLHDNLADLIENLKKLVDPAKKTGSIADMESRLEIASTIAAETVDEERDAWQKAHASILQSPIYHGLTLEPMIGLIPLGEDPESKLWEFWVWETGERPERDATSQRWKITGDTGMVLVLLPGGTFTMGCQKDIRLAPNYDPEALSEEGPVHSVTLAPFFLSKYELTQGQLSRVTGMNPSRWKHLDEIDGAAHPVEQVSYDDCIEALLRVGLVLPTEAQWEYGARGGTTTPYWNDAAHLSLKEAANVADLSYPRRSPNALRWENWDDGYPDHAPVGSFAPNGFGLHDTAGNVWEWCLDEYGSYALPVKPGTGERLPEAEAPTAPENGGRTRVFRGGGFQSLGLYARSARRIENAPALRADPLGCRPARAMDP